VGLARQLYLASMTVARVGSKGQVVIPKAVRDQAQLHPGDEVDIAFDDERIVIAPRRQARALGGRFGRSGMPERLLEDRQRESR
jgi:AbrB family looped-hinge helix DNA binding protein